MRFLPIILGQQGIGEENMIESKTITDYLRHNAKTAGKKNWLYSTETGRTVTWKGAYKKAIEVAGQLKDLGAAEGSSVAFASNNSLNAVLLFLGITVAGYRATPLNLVAGKQNIAYVLGHSKTKIVFAERNYGSFIYDAALESGEDMTLCSLDREGDYILPDADPFDGPFPTAEDAGLLMYTSGTTGNPKGVLLSHKNLITGGENVAAAHQLTEADIGYCVLPIYHINGLAVTVLGSLVSGGGLVLPPRFSKSQFWQQVYDHKCTWFSAVPTLFSYLLSNDETPLINHERLRFARSASAPLSPEIHRQFEERFGIPIIETMGLTETTAQILSNPLPPGKRKIGSPGIGYGNEVKVVNPETFADCAAGIEGEIVIRGDNVMMGYLDQPDETKKTITADGWLRSGDLGHVDEEGYVYVTGRIKELIIKGGENIAPREIDEVLLSYSGILEAAAFALPCDNYGQRIEACVRLKDGEEFDEAELLAYCHSRLGAFKSPDRIYELEDLPKGPSGKVQRMKLAEVVSAA